MYLSLKRKTHRTIDFKPFILQICNPSLTQSTRYIILLIQLPFFNCNQFEIKIEIS